MLSKKCSVQQEFKTSRLKQKLLLLEKNTQVEEKISKIHSSGFMFYFSTMDDDSHLNTVCSFNHLSVILADFSPLLKVRYINISRIKNQEVQSVMK